MRYRPASTWFNGPQGVTTTSATITGLAADTLYFVQVRATNSAGDSAWSPTASGTTGPASALVSNQQQGSPGQVSSVQKLAQNFTTGANSRGYLLTTIEIRLRRR